MRDSALEAALKRDRAIVLGALLLVVVLAWAYIVWLAHDMAPMTGMSPTMPVQRAWSAGDVAFTFTMWAMMMIGMMAPSAAPIVLMYARVARQARIQGHVFASSAWVAAGYFLAWIAFAVAATLAQYVLLNAALITPMLADASREFGAVMLIAAGIYQWTPLKDACLAQCRAPLDFIMRHGGFRPEPWRALLTGLSHGVYCVGCCWALMALLFVGGVMNVLWIAAIAIFVLAERVLPGGRWLARLGGAALVVAGIWMLFAPNFAA